MPNNYGLDPNQIPIGQGSGGTNQFRIYLEGGTDLRSDTVDLTIPVRALRVNTAGNVAFIAFNDDAAETWICVAGEIIPMYVKRVMLTGTSATDIIGLY